MAVLSSSSSTEEWYVGINGVPVGPVRLSDLRRKASNGLITEESLVWREGFEEWVPLRTFPELAAMLKESATAGRTSLTPTPGTASPVPSNRAHAPLPRAPAPAGSGVRPSVTPRGVGSQPRSNVLAFAARGATAEKIDGLSEPSMEEHVRADESVRPPAAPPVPVVVAAPVLPEVFEPIQFRAAGFSQRPHRPQRHPFALGLVVLLCGILLGVVTMVVLMPKSNVKPAAPPVVSAAPPVAPAASVAQPAENEGNTTVGPIEVSAPVVPPTKSTKASKAAAAVDTPSAPAAPLSTSLTGLGGLVGGPSAPSGGSSSGSSGGQLQTVDLERVVQSHRAFVKRQCWDPALGARAPNAPSSARVVVAINVGRDGNVQNANATGGDGYPGLSSCVQGQVKNWKFPQSDGTTSFTVPFVFAAQ
jgi:outer membrane biosynthesis protein TonB